MKHAGKRESEMQAVVMRISRALSMQPVIGQHGFDPFASVQRPTDRMADWMKPAGVGKHSEVRDGS